MSSLNFLSKLSGFIYFILSDRIFICQLVHDTDIYYGSIFINDYHCIVICYLSFVEVAP